MCIVIVALIRLIGFDVVLGAFKACIITPWLVGCIVLKTFVLFLFTMCINKVTIVLTQESFVPRLYL